MVGIGAQCDRPGCNAVEGQLTFGSAICDHGSGIPDSFKARIYEKFAQADATDLRQKGGTGLGLSIVKGIVTRPGGSTGFSDAPGGGTIFHIDLPAWQNDIVPVPRMDEELNDAYALERRRHGIGSCSSHR
jgi:K+-sensing histidine kinase KdpD